MFSIYNSAFANVLYFDVKTCDLFYKTNHRFSHFPLESKITGVVLSITFKDAKVSSRLASTIFGFGLQILLTRFYFSSFTFGFKQKVKFACFAMQKQNFFNELSFFFFSTLVYKAVPLGLFRVPGNECMSTVKFCASDLFGFFGIRFFSKFYLDFFDWPAKFVFTYAQFTTEQSMVVPVYFSCFKVSFF